MIRTTRTFSTYVLAALFAAWLIGACWNTATRIAATAKGLNRTWGMDRDAKRRLLSGHLADFAERCRREIPQNSTVFVVSDALESYYQLSYYLYPRKVLRNAADRRVDRFADNTQAALTPEFLKSNNISYVLVPGESRIIRKQ
jgi:hypothetical protein